MNPQTGIKAIRRINNSLTIAEINLPWAGLFFFGMFNLFKKKFEWTDESLKLSSLCRLFKSGSYIYGTMSLLIAGQFIPHFG